VPYNPHLDAQRAAQEASKRSMDFSNQAAARNAETSRKFAQQAQESAAREFQKRISAGSTGMSGGQGRGGLVLFAIIALVILLPIVGMVAFLFVGAKLLGG
jgi:hypothetical protein